MESTKRTKKASKPSPAVEKKRAYKELVALRRKVESTANDLAVAERYLRSAQTISSDFTLRKRAVAEASESVSVAREVHAEAVRDFEILRRKK